MTLKAKILKRAAYITTINYKLAPLLEALAECADALELSKELTDLANVHEALSNLERLLEANETKI